MPAAGKKKRLRAQGETGLVPEKGVVMVVDDEPDVRTFAKLAIERSGYAVLAAADGAEAVETMRAHAREISLVLLDMNMPGMSAEAAFQALREIRPVPVLLTSGSLALETPADAAFSGASGFLQKPYTLQALAQAIDRAAGQTGHSNGNHA